MTKYREEMDMDKQFKVFRIVITIIAWVMFVASLIFLAFSWNALPDTIGVHFNPPTGEFDLYDEKIYALYPYGVWFGAMLVLEIAGILVNKIKTGMKIMAEGEKIFRRVTFILLDVIKICLSIFWLNWAICVIRQTQMIVWIPLAVSEIVRIAFVLFLIVVIVIRIKYRESNVLKVE